MNIKYNQWGVIAVLTVTCTFVVMLTHNVTYMYNANSIRNCERSCSAGLAKYSTTRVDLGYSMDRQNITESCECVKPTTPLANARYDDPCEGRSDCRSSNGYIQYQGMEHLNQEYFRYPGITVPDHNTYR